MTIDIYHGGTITAPGPQNGFINVKWVADDGTIGNTELINTTLMKPLVPGWSIELWLLSL
jgi:hypothetical protein